MFLVFLHCDVVKDINRCDLDFGFIRLGGDFCHTFFWLTPFFSFSSDLLSRIDLDELMKKDEPPFTFPKTLEEFEYAFNECKYIFEFSKHKAQQALCFNKEIKPHQMTRTLTE